jgi:hypothetical protein
MEEGDRVEVDIKYLTLWDEVSLEDTYTLIGDIKKMDSSSLTLVEVENPRKRCNYKEVWIDKDKIVSIRVIDKRVIDKEVK